MVKKIFFLLLSVLLLEGCGLIVASGVRVAKVSIEMLNNMRIEAKCEDHGRTMLLYEKEVNDHRGKGTVEMVLCRDGEEFEITSWQYDYPVRE